MCSTLLQSERPSLQNNEGIYCFIADQGRLIPRSIFGVGKEFIKVNCDRSMIVSECLLKKVTIHERTVKQEINAVEGLESILVRKWTSVLRKIFSLNNMS